MSARQVKQQPVTAWKFHSKHTTSPRAGGGGGTQTPRAGPPCACDCHHAATELVTIYCVFLGFRCGDLITVESARYILQVEHQPHFLGS